MHIISCTEHSALLVSGYDQQIDVMAPKGGCHADFNVTHIQASDLSNSYGATQARCALVEEGFIRPPAQQGSEGVVHVLGEAHILQLLAVIIHGKDCCFTAAGDQWLNETLHTPQQLTALMAV